MAMSFRYRVLDEAISYTGRELRGGWVEANAGLEGDAAAGFIGPCRVPTAHLVDLDDARAGATIDARSMAHVIVEHPGCDLRAAVLRQRLLVCILCEILAARGVTVERRGDDVFTGGRKLTVSIAAPHGGGALIHLGINVDPGGAPVPAVGLEELGVDARALLDELLAAYGRELDTAAYAETKVKEVD
jgi:hypothetical protein